MYWYNTQLGERFNWWETHRSYIDRCSLICHLPELSEKPNFYSQKKQLPTIKQDLIIVGWSKELLNFSSVPSQTLQEVCKRAEKAFSRFISGDSNGKRSGKPRFKNRSRFRSMVFEGAKLHSCSIGGKWLDLSLPKLGIIKIRHHRSLPDGVKLKSVQVVKKAVGWFINFRLEDKTVPEFKADIVPTWNNSIGMDAVLHEDDYLATSEGTKLPSLKSFRKSQNKLIKISRKKNASNSGSKARRKLAKKEGKLHSRVASARRDHAFKTAHALIRTGKKVLFYEKLNLSGLSRRNKAKQDDTGKYLPNGQSRSAGLNKSWADAAFGQFFTILDYIAQSRMAQSVARRDLAAAAACKAGAVTMPVNPAYTSQILSYKDEFVFTNVSIREYWDEKLKLKVDRDINSGINIKRVGLDLFPTIKRRKGNRVVVASTTNSTSKEVLSTLRGLEKPALYA